MRRAAAAAARASAARRSGLPVAEPRLTLPVSTPWRDGGAVDEAIGEIVRRLRVKEDLFSLHLVSSHMRQCCYNGCQFPKATMVRFVGACDAEGVTWLVPDAGARLPGRGAYTLACPKTLALAALQPHIFARQLKRPVRPLPDLVARTEQALASHCGVLVRQALMAHLAREREPLAEPLKKSHVWRVQAWEPERAGVVPAAAVSASLAEAGAEEARPQRKQMLLFALSESELGRAQGGADAGGGGTTNADQQTPSWATIPSFSVAFPLSLALSAAQWRLEAFRAGCRPPGIRPSGEEERRKESVAASPSIEIQ